MANPFDTNRALLQHHRPALWSRLEPFLNQPFPGQILRTGGLINLRCKDPHGNWIDVHPPHDPQAKCREYVDYLQGREGQLIFLLGFGLGYEALAICQAYGTLNQIKIIDHDPVFFAQAVKFIDLSPIITNPAVSLHIGIPISDYPGIIAGLDRWHLLHAPPELLKILPFGKIFPAYYQAAAAALQRLLLGQYMQSNTTMLRGKDMLENSFQLLPEVIAASPLESLRGFAPGVPAIITAAGPSLKENISRLQEKEREIIILAVDSSVPTLLENGITPHFIITMDYRHRNADFLWGNLEKLSSCALIFLGLTTPFIPKLLPGKKIAVYDQAPINAWLNRMTGDHLPIKDLTSVAHLALFAAQLMECDPIIFAGLDLSWNGPLDAKTIREEDLQQIPGVKQEHILTTPNFLVMIDKFEKMMESSSTTYIDSTEGGARLRHTLLMPLEQSLATYCRGPLRLPVLPEKSSAPAIRDTCLARLAATQKNLLTLRQEYLTIQQQASWACDFLNNHIRQNRQLTVTQQLADTVNSLKQRHAELVSAAGSDELNATAHLLDILLAKQRLASHGKLIGWRKKYPDQSGISGLLIDMLFHQTQATDMLESISWFLQRIETAVARLKCIGHPPAMNQYRSGADLLPLGKIYFDSFDLIPARQIFLALLERQPDHAEAHYYLGRILLLLRQLPDAVAHFQTAKTLAPELGPKIDAMIAEISAEFLENAKDRIKRRRHGARKYLQDILPGFPDYGEAQQLLASLN